MFLSIFLLLLLLLLLLSPDRGSIVHVEPSAAAGAAAAASTVAAAFCGYLNLAIPEAGATARRYLIQPLRADVLVAGSHKASDCGGGPDYSCLWSRLAGLGPLAARSLSRKLTDDEIREAVQLMPHYATVAGAFRMSHTFHGITNWTPLLGSPKAHMIHQIRDYALLLELIRTAERARGAAYERVVFSRLEFVWLAPHPPLALLPPSLLWVPFGSPRMNDRHVVMNRSHADVWMGRWALFGSAALLRKLPLQSLAHDGPEELVENLLVTRGISVGEFPGTSYLPCCAAAEGCALQGGFCYERPLGFCDGDDGDGALNASSASAQEAASPPAGTVATTTVDAREEPGGRSSARRCAQASGKYHVEVGLATAHATELVCSNGRFTSTAAAPPPQAHDAAASPSGRWVCTDRCFWSLDGRTPSTPRLYRGRVGIVAASSVAPPSSSSSRPPVPPAAAATSAPASAFACTPPAAQRGWDEAATRASERAGYCAATETGDAGDCARGHKGSWRLHPWMRGWTRGIFDELSCVRHCVRHCARCRFVSVSMADGDCSWYHDCAVDALQTQFSRGHRTFAIVRHGSR